jgi:hypothetical protein
VKHALHGGPPWQRKQEKEQPDMQWQGRASGIGALIDNQGENRQKSSPEGWREPIHSHTIFSPSRSPTT